MVLSAFLQAKSSSIPGETQIRIWLGLRVSFVFRFTYSGFAIYCELIISFIPDDQFIVLKFHFGDKNVLNIPLQFRFTPS
jgi:hypothetical protein